jgi:hypothetical protein
MCVVDAGVRGRGALLLTTTIVVPDRPRPLSPKSPRTQPATPSDRGGFARLPSELVDLVLLFVCDSLQPRLVCHHFAAQLRWMCDLSARDDPSRFARALAERARSAALRLNALRLAMRERDFLLGPSVLNTGAYSFIYERMYRLCTAPERHGLFTCGKLEYTSRGNRLLRFHNRLHFEFAHRVLPVLGDPLVRRKVVCTLSRLCLYFSKGFCSQRQLPDIGTSLWDLCASHAKGNAGRYLLRLDRFSRIDGTLDHWRACVDAQAARHPGREELSFQWPYPRLVPCLDDAACRAFALLEQDTRRAKTDAEMDLIRALLVPNPDDVDSAAPDQ